MSEVVRALAINTAILQVLAHGREHTVITICIDPPWTGTIGDALDMADAALGVDAEARPVGT